MTSFAIEAPAETNPLTERLVLHSLISAASSDPNQIQTGTKQLQQWERARKYYPLLQEAYLDPRLPLEVRYLAIIQLKNGIDKYWRKTATNAVSREDKDVIKSRLVDSAAQETDDRLALQNALLIAKIARFEYPGDWPDLLTSLTDLVRQEQGIKRNRALLILLHIVKELSTGRLQRTRQSLQAATPTILSELTTTYAVGVKAWQKWRSDTTISSMQQTLLLMKVLRRLLITGYEHASRDTGASSLWKLTQQHFDWFTRVHQAGCPYENDCPYKMDCPYAPLVFKHVVQYAKLHHEMAREHPAAFALLPGFTELVHAYWHLVKHFGEDFGSKQAVVTALATARIGTNGDTLDGRPRMEKLALKGLLIIRACVRMVHNPTQTFKYRTPEDKVEKTSATEIIQQQVLTHDFVKEVMETVVTRFFVFQQMDLIEWEQEPEEWEKREEGDGEDWEFSIRSCSEKLFLDLAINYKDILVAPLLQVFYSVANPDNENILFKDSVYTAIGLAAPVIHEQLDFDAFVREVLIVEVQKSHAGYSIIRRRAAILLGQWIAVKISDATRPIVYQIFRHLLDQSDPLNDEVVRVTAGRQFKNICDDWEFKAEQFEPHAEIILMSLMKLIEDVGLPETKMALLDTISNIVVRLDHRIAPFAERIVNMLPSLWTDSGDEHLTKQAILTILARLVEALKAEGTPLHQLALPIIRGAIEPGSETQVYLLDDALDLWANILVQTPEPASTELLDLIPSLYPVYELGSENLRKALEITESYVLLVPEHMLSDQVRIPLITALQQLLGTLRPDANGLVCNLLEIMIRKAGDLGGEPAVISIAASLNQADLSGKLLDGLKGSWIAHCTTGPNRKGPPVDGVVETDYFAILARMILGSTAAFVQSCQYYISKTEPQGQPLEATMKWLLEEWFAHFENVGDPSRRKLMCLALTELLDTNQAFILLNLQSLMTIWTDVISELREDVQDTSGDSLVYSNGDTAYRAEGPEPPEDVRRRRMTYSDVVHAINLPAFVTEHLQRAIEAYGGLQKFEEEWLANVDRDVLSAFSQLGII